MVFDPTTRWYRTTVRGPGPHEIAHGLGTGRVIVHAVDDKLDNFMYRIDIKDTNTVVVEIGYFSIPARDWIVGCNDNDLVHVWVNA